MGVPLVATQGQPRIGAAVPGPLQGRTSSASRACGTGHGPRASETVASQNCCAYRCETPPYRKSSGPPSADGTTITTTTATGATTPATEAAPRQVGRPRDPRVDAAIVGATLQLLADSGYASLTMEAVATAAGVGKATLYRRYAGKEQLVIDAVATMNEPPEVVRGASVRDELVARLEAVRRTSDSSLAGKIFPRLVSAGADNPELMRNYRRQVLAPRRQAFAEALQRGIDEGLVRADVDLDYAIDLLVGPMAYRNLIRNDPPPGPELAAHVVDDVLVALAPRPAPPEDPA